MLEATKVFISYSHDSDKHRQSILELSDRFREDGIDCYIDQYISGAPPEGWPRWMEKQIQSSDFVLVVCTELYLKRFNGEDRDGGRGVNFESTLASQIIYDDFQENDKFYPVIPDQGSIDHVPLVLKRGSTYKYNIDYESIYRILTKQPSAEAKPLGKLKHYPSEQTSIQNKNEITQIVSDTRQNQQSDPVKSSPTKPTVLSLDHTPFYVPYESKGPGAIGIEEILKTVHETITSSKKTTIGQGASFQGIGGLGKTQLAVEYAHRYRDQYEGGVVWITVDQNIETQLVDLAEKTKWVNLDVDAKAKMDIAKARYSALNNTLLIYDNVDHYDEIKSLFPQLSNHILLTSRKDIQGFKSVPLNTLDEENALKLLSHESGRHIEENELEAAKTLVENFDGLPLALEMAGAYVDHLEISWNDYLSLFEAKGLSFIERADIRGSTTKHESNIRNTLSLSDELLEATDNIKNIINLLAWGANEAIDQTLMANMLNENQIELIEPIAIAKKLKIIKKEEDGYILHRLVRDVWKEQRPLNSTFAETVAKNLAAYMKSIQAEFLYLRKIDRAALQAHGWVDNISNVDTKAQLLGSSAFPDYHMGRYKKGLRLVDRALSLLNLDTDSIILSDIYTLKGDLTQPLGNYKEAKLYFQKSLEIQYRLNPNRDCLGVAASLSNMGAMLDFLEDYEAAKSHHQKSLKMVFRLLPNQDHPILMSSLNNMGAHLDHLGDLKTAKTYYQQALEMGLRLYTSQDHPDVMSCLNNMGFVLYLLDEAESAKTYLQRSLEMNRRLYSGQSHPNIAKSLNNLGRIFLESGDNLEAKVLLNEALDMFQDLEIELPIQQRIIKTLESI